MTNSVAAIVGLGASLRPEVARYGVGVTVVCPGPIETPLLDTVGSTPGLQVRRYLTAAAGAPIPAETFARLVVEAVRKDRALVVPGRAGLIWRLSRWAPNLTSRQITKSMRQELAAAHLS